MTRSLSGQGSRVGSFRTLLIGGSEVAGVLADTRVKAVTLTGSEPAGRSVASIAGDHVKKSVLELGGSDPFIVMPSADVSAAAATAVRARISNNGQSCIAGKRFIVHTEVYDAFAAEFVKLMSELVVGDPLDPATQVGPLATLSGRDELAELVEDARALGAQVLTGGVIPEGPGFFYAPTVLAGLSEEMRIIQEETFGPVASLYRAGTARMPCGLPTRPPSGFPVRSGLLTPRRRNGSRPTLTPARCSSTA